VRVDVVCIVRTTLFNSRFRCVRRCCLQVALVGRRHRFHRCRRAGVGLPGFRAVVVVTSTLSVAFAP
jgi:hypothetical protein